MPKKPSVIPDAWDDDWEQEADRVTETEPPQPPEPVPRTKAERLALHAETNRQLWESADTPERFHFLEANSQVPLATTFKPAVKVLSRKPAPQAIVKKDPVTGIAQLTLDDRGDDDDEPEGKTQESAEEIRARQQRELEARIRRYEEARAKIFGEADKSSSAATSSVPTPGSHTPPRDQRGSPKPRGRGRGGRRGNLGGSGGTGSSEQLRGGDERRGQARSGTRELYDPDYAAKPAGSSQKRGDFGQSATPDASKTAAAQPVRNPRGPDNSGPSGFGFAKRGGRTC